MGGSASVHIHPPHITHSYFKELLSSRKKRNELFDDIAKLNHGHIALKTKLNINQLSSFFIDPTNPQLSDFPVDVDCLLSALKKCAKRKPHDHLSRKEFHIFLPTLFLFSKLRLIFKEMDGEVVQDNKIFKGEFIKWKRCLSTIDGIEIGAECTDESWANEFDAIDSIKKDGHITFNEFCKYCLEHLTKTDRFINEFIHPDDEDHEVDEAAVDVAIEAHIVHDMEKVKIGKGEENQEVVVGVTATEDSTEPSSIAGSVAND